MSAEPEKMLSALEAVLGSGDRSSMVDLAAELSIILGGAKGIALLIKTMLFDPETTIATKQRLLGIVLTFLKEVSKIQGDRDEVEQMSVEGIEREVLALVMKHGQIPVQGGRWLFERGSGSPEPALQASPQA